MKNSIYLKYTFLVTLYMSLLSYCLINLMIFCWIQVFFSFKNKENLTDPNVFNLPFITLWFDPYRDSLWKFFLPADYQSMNVSEVATPGKPRQILAFELRMNIIADATIDLLFTKNRVFTHTYTPNDSFLSGTLLCINVS